MTRGSVRPLIHYLRTLATASASGDRTDEELLDRFLSRRDEDAFAALVRRYGPLVFGVHSDPRGKFIRAQCALA